MPKSEELTSEEQDLVRQLLLLTGREDRTANVKTSQVPGIKAIWLPLKSSVERGLDFEATCDLVNRILITLAIKPISYSFYNVVFGNVDFSKIDQLADSVRKFRTLCMLEYGNFRYGYKTFKEDNERLSDKWEQYFPSHDEKNYREIKLRTRPEPAGLIPIDPSQLFALGYLASEQALKINGARKELLTLLEAAVETNVNSWSELQTVARDQEIEDLPRLLARCGIPGTEALWLALWAGGRPYGEIVKQLKDNCTTVDENAIAEAKNKGEQNAYTYLAMHDLDVYVATSMRDPLNFTTNWAFVRELFHNGELSDWHLRYFDPTQAYLPDRIQKGLMECLMIKRAAVTVYNAQESDTFGKDAELGVTLAERKPGVVYVARLFDHDETISRTYRSIDAQLRSPRDKFIDALLGDRLLDEQDVLGLRAPEKSKGDALEFVIRKSLNGYLKGKDQAELGLELVRQGYSPPKGEEDLVDFCMERIVKLERRALTFREIHPLSLQTSPFDGVARGVIVTRTVPDTARVLSGLLRYAMEYDIIEEDGNWLLVDKVTHSPVRVVTKNTVLTAAFWSEPWGNNH